MDSSREELYDVDEDIDTLEGLNEDKSTSKHPLLEDFLIQYPRCWEEAAERSFLVYQDLTEVRGWWFTQLGFSEQLERPYVAGQETRNGKHQIVLPIGMDEQVSVLDVQAFLDFKASMRLADEIILAVNDLDSTLVYYNLARGLQPPDPPEVAVDRKRERNEKKNKKRQHIAKCVRQAIERLNKETT